MNGLCSVGQQSARSGTAVVNMATSVMGEDTPKKPHPGAEKLTPWKKGVSGNPDGHSKSRRLTAALNKLLASDGKADETALILYGAMIGDKALIGMDANGSPREPSLEWYREIANRTEGKVADKNEITFPGSDQELAAAIESLAGGSGSEGDAHPGGDAGEDLGASGEASPKADDVPPVR